MVSMFSKLAAPLVGASFAAWDLNLMPESVNQAVKSVIGLVPPPPTSSFVVPPKVHAYTMNLAFCVGTAFLIFVVAKTVFKSPSENPEQILPR